MTFILTRLGQLFLIKSHLYNRFLKINISWLSLGYKSNKRIGQLVYPSTYNSHFYTFDFNTTSKISSSSFHNASVNPNFWRLYLSSVPPPCFNINKFWLTHVRNNFETPSLNIKCTDKKNSKFHREGIRLNEPYFCK